MDIFGIWVGEIELDALRRLADIGLLWLNDSVLTGFGSMMWSVVNWVS